MTENHWQETFPGSQMWRCEVGSEKWILFKGTGDNFNVWFLTKSTPGDTFGKRWPLKKRASPPFEQAEEIIVKNTK